MASADIYTIQLLFYPKINGVLNLCQIVKVAFVIFAQLLMCELSKILNRFGFYMAARLRLDQAGLH